MTILDVAMAAASNMHNSLEDKIDVRLIEPCIIENTVKSGVYVVPELLWALKKKNLEITANEKYCVLVRSEHLSEISKEARELAASKEYTMNTVAKALLVESTGHRIIGNFYISINKPHIKTKLFTEREKAIQWLREQLKGASL